MVRSKINENLSFIDPCQYSSGFFSLQTKIQLTETQPTQTKLGKNQTKSKQKNLFAHTNELWEGLRLSWASSIRGAKNSECEVFLSCSLTFPCSSVQLYSFSWDTRCFYPQYFTTSPSERLKHLLSGPRFRSTREELAYCPSLSQTVVPGPVTMRRLSTH